MSFNSGGVLSLLPQGITDPFPFPLIVVIATSSFPVLSHSSSFVMTFDQKMPRIRRSLLFPNVCTLESRAFVRRQVSDPYISTDLTLELNILRFVLREHALAFQTAMKHTNTYCALLIRAVISSSVPPVTLTMLPM